MKPPLTDAEWDALLEAEERDRDATRTDAEYWAVFREQAKLWAARDDGTSRDAFEVLDEIQAEIDAKHPGTGNAGGPA
jgi:TolB-like protein